MNVKIKNGKIILLVCFKLALCNSYFLAQLQSYCNELLSAGVTGYFTRVQ